MEPLPLLVPCSETRKRTRTKITYALSSTPPTTKHGDGDGDYIVIQSPPSIAAAMEVEPPMAVVGRCINDTLRDDELQAILAKLESIQDREAFGLVCKRWLHVQSSARTKLCARRTERKRLRAVVEPHMVRRMAARFTNLIDLDLSQDLGSRYPCVTDSDLYVIANALRCLRVLDLVSCSSITDAGMIAIGNGLSYLKCLNVSLCTKLTDEGLSAVAEGCRDLRILDLACCRKVTDALLKALSENCHDLEELVLQGCPKISNSGLVVLVDCCQRMVLLDVSDCSKVGDIGISRVSKVCSSYLKDLELGHCPNIGDESMLSLAKFCKNLEILVISGCWNVSDECIKSLAAACNHNLRVLRMNGCSNVFDSALNCIFSRCKNLTVLDIGCCKLLTDAAFEGLGREGSDLSLKFFHADKCPKITVAGLSMLLESCNSLEHLSMKSCPYVTKVACAQAALQFPKCCKIIFMEKN